LLEENLKYFHEQIGGFY